MGRRLKTTSSSYHPNKSEYVELKGSLGHNVASQAIRNLLER